MNKKIWKVLCLIFLMLSLSVPVYGWSDTPLLVDGADLLTNSEEKDLLHTLQNISQNQQMDIVVLTVDSLTGMTARNYADDFYDYNGYEEDGILLLVSMEYRDWYISTTGYGIHAVTDAGIEYMANRFLDDLGDGDYYDAFMTYAELCDAFITQAKNDTPYDVGNMPKGKYPFGFSLLISLGIGLVAALIITGVMAAQLKGVSPQHSAKNYVKQGSLNVTRSQDLFINRHVHRQAKPKQTSSGGGSSTHTSSSGRSHGGGGGKF